MAEAGNGSTGLLGLFWAAFKRCRNGMILVDDDRRCVEVNDAFVQLLGYKRSELIGRRYHEFAVKPPLSDEASSELIRCAAAARRHLREPSRRDVPANGPLALAYRQALAVDRSRFAVA